jgi:hypothetical protein
MYRNWPGGGLPENIGEIHSDPNLGADPRTRDAFATNATIDPIAKVKPLRNWYCPPTRAWNWPLPSPPLLVNPLLSSSPGVQLWM